MARTLLLGMVLFLCATAASAQTLPSALALALGAQEFALRETARRPDPIPLRRVWLAPGDPLPAAPVGDPLRRLSREEFERRVQSAAHNVPAVPKLVRAEYRGSLVDDALAGTAEWQFASDGPGAFPLDTLKLALRNGKWSDGRTALLGGVPAKLWIERGGRSTASFAWSTRGAEEPGQIRFQLAAPAAPLALLELELPADRIPSARSGTLLAGPAPRPGGRAAWRFAFGGETSLEIVVRSPLAGRPQPVVSFQRVARYDLAPGLATLACEFDASALRHAPTSLEFTLDPGLGVSEVTAPGLAGWKVDANRLTVAFREPFTSGRIVIAAAAAFPADGQPWVPPLIQAPDLPLAGDQIELLLAPELRFDGLEPGDYRAVRGAATERGQTLNLRGTLPADAAAARRPPALRARGTPAEYATVETMDWRIDAGRTALTARFRATVARGPLTRLVVRMPAGLTPLAATLTPDDPTVVLASLGGGLWAIEPTHPVATGDTLDARLEVRGSVPRFESNRAAMTLANPSPVGAGRRDGTMTIQLEPTLRGWSTRAESDFSEAGIAMVKYSRDELVPIVLASRALAVPESPEPPRPPPAARSWQFADLEAEAVLDPDGTAQVELRGRIRGARERELPIVLPSGGKVEAIRIAGKWVDAPAGERLRLPVPETGAEGAAFSVRYRVPPASGWPIRVPEFRPELPDAPTIRATVLAGPYHRAWPSLAESAQPGTPLLPAAGVRAAGFVAAAILLGFALVPALRRSVDRLGRGFAFVLVAGFGLAAWLAPAGWSLLLAPPLAVALVAWLVMRLRPRAAALAGVAFGALGTGIAQAPAPATVYLMADQDRIVVLAPRSTLQRLAELAAPHRPAALLVDAEYAGTVIDGGMRFEANWIVAVDRVGSHEIELPFAGARLERMMIDGAPAFPDAVRPGRMKVSVSGVGTHVLGAVFVVPAVETPAGREVRCTVPDHPASRVMLAWPADGRMPEFVGRAGARTTTTTGTRGELRADLGAGGMLALRWRDVATTAPVVTVQDATVWTITEARAEALSAFLHKIERGSLTRLVFDIPAGLEVGAFAVRELESPDANGLKDWSLETTPTGTRATLVLRQPARGVLATTFRLVSRARPSARPALAIPRTVTGDTIASHLGVRLSGVTAESWQNEHLLDVPADSVGREFAAVPELEFDRALARSLRREGTNPPVARPLLRGPAPPLAPSSELVWSLGSRAEVIGSGSAAGVVGPVVECPLPPGITVVDVDAADLAGWERAGNRLRVWFKTDVREPNWKWFGSWPAYAPGTTFELPPVPAATYRVRPAEGAAIAVANADAVTWLPSPRPRERVFRTGDPTPAPRFQVHPPTSPTVKRTATLTRTAAGYEHRLSLETTLAPNRPHAFTLVLANPPQGADTRIEWPTDVVGIEVASNAPRKTWLVDCGPRTESLLRIAVVTRFPLRPDPELPSVEILAANVPLPSGEHRLALPPELRPAPGVAKPVAGGWLIHTEGPVRLLDAPKELSTLPAKDDRAATANGDESPRPFRAAIVWLLGLILLGWTGRSWGQPEWTAAYGALAAAVAGSAFLAIVLVGVGWRLVIVLRALGRRVGR